VLQILTNTQALNRSFPSGSPQYSLRIVLELWWAKWHYILFPRAFRFCPVGWHFIIALYWSVNRGWYIGPIWGFSTKRLSPTQLLSSYHPCSTLKCHQKLVQWAHLRLQNQGNQSHPTLSSFHQCFTINCHQRLLHWTNMRLQYQGTQSHPTLSSFHQCFTINCHQRLVHWTNLRLQYQGTQSHPTLSSYHQCCELSCH
jgi:hypothetical protein